jgi:ligand-binding sensor domain-containing protein/two-component sensor histidine kinase
MMKAILFPFFLLVTINLQAQELFFSAPPNFQNLPSSETYQVFQDSKGIIWICTDAGICRYNGNMLTTFTTKNGISENVVLKAYEDEKGRIWFNTLSGYFFYFSNNQFHAIGANEYLKKICKSFPVNSFFIGENDTLYCATALDTSLIKIPPQHNYHDVIRVQIAACNRFFYTNRMKSKESIMGGGPDSVYLKSHFYSVLINDRKVNVRFQSYAFSGNVWRGQIDQNGTTYIPEDSKLTVIKKNDTLQSYFKLPASIINIYTDKEGDLWIGTFQHGGFLFPKGDLSLPPIRFLTNLSISSILVDREGIIWVTTLEKGVFQSLNKYLLYLNEKDDQVTFAQKNKDLVHVGYASKRIISLSTTNVATMNDELKMQKTAGSAYLHCFSMNDQYDYFSLNDKIVGRNKKEPHATLKLITDRGAFQLITIGKDSMLAINSHTLVLINKDKLVRYWKTPFPNLFITQLKNKKILICSRNNNGIYELKNDTIERYLPEVTELTVRINCIAEDNVGNLWLATNEHGLYCYDQQKKLHHFNNTEDKINALAFDKKNQLWVGTNNGLSKINFTKDLNKLFITPLKKNHGIPNEEIKTLIEFNGKIGCITKNVFFYFGNEQLKKNSMPPLTYIDSVFINDKTYIPNQQPTLKFDKNNIHIFTSLISYRNGNHNEYLYQLKGYDQNWRYSTTGDIQYTNLPHGTYTFMVHGLNNDKVKSDQPAIFTFTIEKPFWLTWWFILLEISIVLIIIYFSIRYGKNKIEKREREKASVNQEISEFKMTALRSQMNPHFIFNAIGSIQHYILQNEVKQSYNYLSKFSTLIRNILNNSRQEYIFLAQEINTLQLYIELEQIRFTEPFQFNIEIDEQLDMDMDIPTMLIQPYVENSIWHGLMPKKSGGILELIFKKEENSMRVIIRDNGVGRQITDPAKKHVSKGMSITEQRINILTSTNKKKFITTIVDLKDEDGQSIGTEVNLTIPFEL